MVDYWMPGAEKMASAPGSSLVGGPPRCTWHITDDALKPQRPTFLGVMRYLQSMRFEPTLGWDPMTGRTVQFISAALGARALENHAGGVETNRMGRVHVQIEAFFTPGMVVNGKTYAQLTDTPMLGLGEILAWLDSLGIPRTWATPRGSRSVPDWLNKGGHRAHYNVPENSHVDIVGADTRKLLMLDPSVPTPTSGDIKMDKATADAIRAIIQDELGVVIGERRPDRKDTDPAHISTSDIYTRLEAIDARLAAKGI